jgi:Tol biopolymer transport system component
MNGSLKFVAAGLAVILVAGVGLAIYFSRPVGPAATQSPGQSPAVTAATPTQPAVLPPATSTISTQPTDAGANKPPFVVFLLKLEGSGSTTPRDLWAMRADGTGAQLIFPELGLPSIAWTKDGSRLLANAEDVNGISHIYVADVSDTVGEFVDTGASTGADTACLEKSGEPFPCQSSAFAFAPDGERVVFVQSCTYVLPGCGFLSIVNLRTGELTELTETLQQGRHKGGIALPAWSPDGTRIAFTRETDQGVIGEGGVPESNLFLINADGTNLHKVDLTVPRVMAPQWSPDGSRIALMSDIWPQDGGLEQDVYTVKPDGSDLLQLTTDGRSAWPEWTLSGGIKFRNQNATQTSMTFSVMDADGSNMVALSDLDPLISAIEPPQSSSGNITVPGDPGETFFWQPFESWQPFD